VLAARRGCSGSTRTARSRHAPFYPSAWDSGCIRGGFVRRAWCCSSRRGPDTANNDNRTISTTVADKNDRSLQKTQIDNANNTNNSVQAGDHAHDDYNSVYEHHDETSASKQAIPHDDVSSNHHNDASADDQADTHVLAIPGAVEWTTHN
jgi:hypothetical protein